MTTNTLYCPPCPFCGKVESVEISAEEYTAWIINRELAQNAMPNRSSAFRELLITGSHPECWEKAFAEMPDEEEPEYDPGEPPADDSEDIKFYIHDIGDYS